MLCSVPLCLLSMEIIIMKHVNFEIDCDELKL